MHSLIPRALAAESSRSRLERWSFNLVFGLLGGIATLLLVAPTVIVLITSFTSAFSLKFPPPMSQPSALRGQPPCLKN